MYEALEHCGINIDLGYRSVTLLLSGNVFTYKSEQGLT